MGRWRVSEKAVIYARVSTGIQGEGYSLATQIESCRRYAAAHGYRVVREFSEQQSGELLRRRQMNKLLEYAREDDVQVVVAHDLDRFTRNPTHLAILELELEQAGARVEFVLGDYADTPEGKLSKMIRSVIAQYENRQRHERTQRGRRGRIQAGLVRQMGSRAPYGYHYVIGGGELVVVEEEAQIVRWLFEQAAAGSGAHTLAANLTAAGVMRADGKIETWHSSTVLRILRRSVYSGIWVEQIHGEQHTAAVPAIVDSGLWAAVQQRLEIPRSSAARRLYVLTGFVTCSCGRPWIGRARSRTVAYYRCSSLNSRARREACPMPGSIRAERLEEAVWDTVAALFQQPEWLDVALAARRQEIAVARAAHEARIAVVAGAMVQLNQREGALLDALLDGRMAATAAASAQTEIQVERERLEAERAALLETVLPTLPDVDHSILGELVKGGLANMAVEQRRRIYTLLDLRVVVERQTLVRMSILDGLITQSIDVDPLVRPLPQKTRTPYQVRKVISL